MKYSFTKVQLTVTELFERLERDHSLTIDNAGEVLDIAFEDANGDPDDLGVASFEWDGFHFHGLHTTDTLMHYGNVTAIWTLQD